MIPAADLSHLPCMSDLTIAYRSNISCAQGHDCESLAGLE